MKTRFSVRGVSLLFIPPGVFQFNQKLVLKNVRQTVTSLKRVLDGLKQWLSTFFGFGKPSQYVNSLSRGTPRNILKHGRD